MSKTLPGSSETGGVAVANYLDRIFPSATGDLLGMFGQIQNLLNPGIPLPFLPQPDSYDNFTRNTFSTTHRYNKSLQYRMNNVRSYSHASQLGNEVPIYSLTGVRMWATFTILSGSHKFRGKTDSGSMPLVNGRSGRKDGHVGFDYFMRGATLGFDRALSDKFMAGISVGYSRSDIDLDQDQEVVTSKASMVHLRKLL